jgi:hypothetical protein
VGVGRLWSRGTAEVRWAMVDGAVEIGWKGNLQLPERVLEELEKALGVQKRI